MESPWQRRRILIWGKTRPELSTKYREIVCTGGVFADTKRFVRIYPIPLRYMDDERIFKKYQWIEADIAKSSRDYRPESYKINCDCIQVLNAIPTNAGNWDARAEWIMQPGNVFPSLEALQDQQRKDFTSLGLIKPLAITRIYSEHVSAKDHREFWQHYEEATRQLELPLDPDTGREIRPLRPPEYRFKVRFRCDDERCQQDHDISIRDWETDALYFRLRQNGEDPPLAAEKVVDKLTNDICAPDKDLHFYMGNIFSHQHIFIIGGLWWPKKQEAKQLSLF